MTDTLVAPERFKPTHVGSLKAEDLLPHEYLLRVGSQRCRCGECYMFNELLLVYIHPELTASTGFRKLVPVDTITMGDLRVGTSFLREKQIPICVACLGDRREAAPPAPRITDAQWATALKASAQQAREARATASKAPAKPAIDISKLEF